VGIDLDWLQRQRPAEARRVVEIAEKNAGEVRGAELKALGQLLGIYFGVLVKAIASRPTL
jgi:hypothetical protein